MGLQPTLDTLSARDHLVGHRRVYGLDTLRADLAGAGFRVDDEFGYFLKTRAQLDDARLPRPAARGAERDLRRAPAPLLANIGIRGVKS